MAVFTRRTIQRLINENNAFFNMPIKEQLIVLNKKVQGYNNQFLAREWEIVVLNAFAHTFKEHGIVIHERKFNKKPLDIFFESSNNPNFNFVADICTISDFGQEIEFGKIKKKYYDFIDKRNLNPSSFRIKVGDNSHSISREKGGVFLYIPSEREIDKKVFNQSFHTFLDEVENNPKVSNQCSIDRVDFYLPKNKKNNLFNKILIWFFSKFYKKTIFKLLLLNNKFRNLVNSFAWYTLILFSYEPNQRYSIEIANNHKTITLLESNTLFYNLKNKHEQLSKSKAPFSKGIIICDGNYDSFGSFYSGTTQWTSKHYDAVDVIKHFFTKTEFSDIDFILFFGVYPYGEHRKIVTKCFVRPNERKLDNSTLEILKGETLISNFPRPDKTVANAVNHLASKNRNVGSTLGGFCVSKKEIKISSRKILEVLAGEISIQEFVEKNFNPIVGNPFESKLKEGKLITSVDVQPVQNEKDDEYLVFTFGEPDAAISDFRRSKS